MFSDALTLDAPRRTKDGYMAVRARAARTGTYQYLGSEIDPDNTHGLRDAGMVNVLRDENTVFDKAAARSFVGKPVTDDHPAQPVNADNWRDHARGMVMGAIRDGEYLAFDLLLTDAAAIKKIQDGKRELSNGYGAELEFGDFKATDGTECVARQVSIAGNHIALVDKGRAGAECRIADAAACEGATVEIARLLLDQILTDERTYSGSNADGINEPARRETSNSGGSHVATKTITFDGLPLEVTDAAEAAITKLQNQIKDAATAKDKADSDLAAANTTLAARDAEIVTLKAEVEDAKVSPAQLRDQAKAYALVCDKAKALDVKFAEDADADAIMKAVVDAKMGDTAKGYDVKQIAAAFDVLTKDAKVEQVDPVRNALSGGVANVGDAKAEFDTARAKQVAALSDAYKTPAKAA